MRVRFVVALIAAVAIGWFTAEARKLDYSFAPPDGSWKKTRAKGADFAYIHQPTNSGIVISSRCEEGAADPPLRILFRHLFIDFETKNITSQRTIELDGKEALLTELTADYGGEHLKFISVIVKRRACVYDLLLIARPSEFDKVKADFEKLVGTFKFR